MSTRMRLKASTPPLIRATTIIRIVTGCRIAKSVGFMGHSHRRLAHAPHSQCGALFTG